MSDFDKGFDDWVLQLDDNFKEEIEPDPVDDEEINDDYLINMSKDDLVQKLQKLNERTLEKEIVNLSPEGFEDLKKMLIEDVLAEIKRRENNELH